MGALRNHGFFRGCLTAGAMPGLGARGITACLLVHRKGGGKVVIQLANDECRSLFLAIAFIYLCVTGEVKLTGFALLVGFGAVLLAFCCLVGRDFTEGVARGRDCEILRFCFAVGGIALCTFSEVKLTGFTLLVGFGAIFQTGCRLVGCNLAEGVACGGNNPPGGVGAGFVFRRSSMAALLIHGAASRTGGVLCHIRIHQSMGALLDNGFVRDRFAAGAMPGLGARGITACLLVHREGGGKGMAQGRNLTAVQLPAFQIRDFCGAIFVREVLPAPVAVPVRLHAVGGTVGIHLLRLGRVVARGGNCKILRFFLAIGGIVFCVTGKVKLTGFTLLVGFGAIFHTGFCLVGSNCTKSVVQCRDFQRGKFLFLRVKVLAAAGAGVVSQDSRFGALGGDFLNPLAVSVSGGDDGIACQPCFQCRIVSNQFFAGFVCKVLGATGTLIVALHTVFYTGGRSAHTYLRRGMGLVAGVHGGVLGEHGFPGNLLAAFRVPSFKGTATAGRSRQFAGQLAGCISEEERIHTVCQRAFTRVEGDFQHNFIVQRDCVVCSVAAGHRQACGVGARRGGSACQLLLPLEVHNILQRHASYFRNMVIIIPGKCDLMRTRFRGSKIEGERAKGIQEAVAAAPGPNDVLILGESELVGVAIQFPLIQADVLTPIVDEILVPVLVGHIIVPVTGERIVFPVHTDTDFCIFGQFAIERNRPAAAQIHIGGRSVAVGVIRDDHGSADLHGSISAVNACSFGSACSILPDGASHHVKGSQIIIVILRVHVDAAALIVCDGAVIHIESRILQIHAIDRVSDNDAAVHLEGALAHIDSSRPHISSGHIDAVHGKDAFFPQCRNPAAINDAATEVAGSLAVRFPEALAVKIAPGFLVGLAIGQDKVIVCLNGFSVEVQLEAVQAQVNISPVHQPVTVQGHITGQMIVSAVDLGQVCPVTDWNPACFPMGFPVIAHRCALRVLRMRRIRLSQANPILICAGFDFKIHRNVTTSVTMDIVGIYKFLFAKHLSNNFHHFSLVFRGYAHIGAGAEVGPCALLYDKLPPLRQVEIAGIATLVDVVCHNDSVVEFNILVRGADAAPGALVAAHGNIAQVEHSFHMDGAALAAVAAIDGAANDGAVFVIGEGINAVCPGAGLLSGRCLTDRTVADIQVSCFLHLNLITVQVQVMSVQAEPNRSVNNPVFLQRHIIFQAIASRLTGGNKL